MKKEMKRCSFRVFSFPDFLKPSYPPCYHTTWELPLKNSPLTPWPVFLFFFFNHFSVEALVKTHSASLDFLCDFPGILEMLIIVPLASCFMARFSFCGVS